MQDSPDKLWTSAQEILRGMLKTEIFNLWFAPIRVRGLQGNALELEVADDFSEVWLRENYIDLVRSVVSRTAGRPLDINFCVGSSPPLSFNGAGLHAAGTGKIRRFHE